jgi:hypothetical protein
MIFWLFVLLLTVLALSLILLPIRRFQETGQKRRMEQIKG